MTSLLLVWAGPHEESQSKKIAAKSKPTSNADQPDDPDFFQRVSSASTTMTSLSVKSTALIRRSSVFARTPSRASKTFLKGTTCRIIRGQHIRNVCMRRLYHLGEASSLALPLQAACKNHFWDRYETVVSIASRSLAASIVPAGGFAFLNSTSMACSWVSYIRLMPTFTRLCG